MSKTIIVEALPHEMEQLLQGAWEGHESLFLERNGKPVAVVVPMEDYQWLRLATERAGAHRRQTETLVESSVPRLAYELPPDLLAAYHRLVDKKFSEGLTPDEDAELERVGAELDAADAATPLEQSAWQKQEERMAVLDDLIAKLKMLQELP